MHSDALTRHLAAHIEPWHGGYRAAAILRDGTRLPCVRFLDRARMLDGLERFHAGREMDGLIERNGVLAADIAQVDASPYAWPASALNQLVDEEMQLTGRFVVQMNDLRCFAFDAGEDHDFLDLPEGYGCEDFRSLLFGHRATEAMAGQADQRVYGSRPSFLCLVEGLQALT